MVIYKNRYLLAAYLASFIFLVIGFSLIYVNFFDNRNLIIIHFDAFNGIDFLGNKWQLYGILLSGIFINIFNGFLAAVFYFKSKFLSYLLAFVSSALSLLILTVIWVIVRVN